MANQSPLDRARKLALIERILGLKHKLKVNDSGHVPQNHKEMAQLMAANWELEDEIKAIEEFLALVRSQAVDSRVKDLIQHELAPRNDGAVLKKPGKLDI